MLKDKIFIKRAAYQFPKIFRFERTNRVCQFCKKTFCCTKCCDRHVDKVHPNVNADCPLCVSEILPIRPCELQPTKLNLEDEKLLSHIVDKHLPLHCRLCGDLFESGEDFKSIVACKWFERWRCLTTPTGHEYLEKKSKLCSRSGSEICNDSRFSTPLEIYRKTSTPMFLDQKAGLETFCVPEFSLKTNSPSIAQIASISKTQTGDTQFFSCVLHSSNEEMTPFKTYKDESFLRSNSGRKLSIMEEQDKIVCSGAKKIIANMIEVSSPIDMDLTRTEGGILEDSPKSDDVREDVMKKVRFSDHKTAAEFGSLMESCVRTVFNMSMEEDEFQDAYDVSNARKVKAIAEKNTTDVNDVEDTSAVEDVKNTDDGKTENKKRSLIQPSKNLLNDSQTRIVQDNTKNIEKENTEVSNQDSTTNQRDSNRVLMMVVMESNSGELTTDLMPLISSGLKKLQEQLMSTKCQSPSNVAETSKICRRSITTMKMRVSSVESYSPNSAPTMMKHGQLASSSSSVQTSENSGGFLSTVTQIMKHALRSISVSGLKMPRSIKASEMTQQREIVEESLPGSSCGVSDNQIRPGKRSREVLSKEDPIAYALDIKSPLAKRQKGWYKMIRGRQPISKMRNSVVTSPRRVSTATQVFSQGSLTVGDTVLPLPARAHQSTE